MSFNSDLSIVIPAWNEQDNVGVLVESLDKVLSSKKIDYELIFIDDNSTDDTVKILKQLAKDYPVSVYKKEGVRGKAQSLIQGFEYCNAPVIVMIDADMQYSPEYIPAMLKKLEREQLDIVVADRTDHQTSFIRKFLSKGFSLFFVRLLHGIKVDSQSGLKVFRKSVLDNVHLQSTGWAFDLDFLIQTRQAGHKIGSVPIVFHPRHAGDAKLNIFKVTWELGTSAIRLALNGLPVVPFSKAEAAAKGKGFKYGGAEFIHHADLDYTETAIKRMGGRQIEFIIIFVLVYALLLWADWHSTLLLTLGTLTVFYFADLMFNLFMIYRSFTKNPEIKITDEIVNSFAHKTWPKYTVFCPLYKEWQVVPQFVAAMSKLDYPKNKLQVMLLLEQNDQETIDKIKEFDLPDYFDIVVVPHSMPKTKPKALNYGLNKATGEYIVIYDAEDVPDVKQLKKAVLAFEYLGGNTICVQAKLNFYNPHQNILTRVFTAEYSLWFDLVLPGMQSLNGPIPLGGTSNHFRTKDVAKLRGWDSFNVTEDCDLGIRLAKEGYTTAIIESTTLEEANSHFWNWYAQRSRWIKGYIQTYLVHMRNPRTFTDNGKGRHLLAFQFIVGGKILSMFINPIMWCITIVYFAFRPILGEFIESFFPSTILYIGVFSFVFGNFLYLYYYMVACAKRGHYDLIKYVYLVPFYWLMMSFASWRAVYEMIVKPHYWAKTKHGLHLASAKGAQQARDTVGSEVIDATGSRSPAPPASQGEPNVLYMRDDN